MSESIAICTLFRDNSEDIANIFNNRSNIDYPKDKILHVCVEGDSADDTFDKLNKLKTKFRIISTKHDTGSIKYGSVADQARLAMLAKLWNIGLDIIRSEKSDYVFILDSDISVDKSIFNQLLSHKLDVVAPMMFFANSTFFRDTWAYCGLDGVNFTNRPPYHQSYKRPKPFKVKSVGLPFMRSVVSDKCMFTNNEVVGLCEQINTNGFDIYVDPLTITYHPRGDIKIPSQYEH